MSKSRKHGIWMLLALCLLIGCSGAVRNEGLRVTLYQYSAAIRWNDIDQAATYLDPLLLEKQPFTAADRDRWTKVQVTRYVEGAQSMDPVGNVLQVVEIELADRDTQQVRSITDRQVWRFDEVAKRWWLSSGLPRLE